MSNPITSRLNNLYASAVHDVLRSRGVEPCVLPKEIRPLDPNLKMAGPVWTFSGRTEPDASAHDTLLAWTTVLSKAPADHVIVCQPHNNDIALMGELSAETLQQRGTLGYLADSGCRDADFILKIGYPVFHKYFTPSDIIGRWIADKLGEPVTIGEVTVNTGDYLIADRDGVVIIPAAIAESVISETESVADTESQVREAIRSGVDPVDAYLKFGKF
ncbi:MAG: RraA family protein [Burkholderiaceae bacterium]